MIIFSKLSYTKITLGYGNRLDYATAFTSRLPPPAHFPAEASCSLGRTSKRVHESPERDYKSTINAG